MKGIVLDIADITDSREVMESRESPKIHWFIYILLIVIISAVIFACFFEIDEYSKVTGEIKTLNAASSVISSSNCKMKEILVSEGQFVKAGDVLFVLDADYAKEQKNILEDKLAQYQSNLSNTKLLKQSVEDDKNLFENNDTNSKFYYRYEQYKNGMLLTAKEIDNSQLNNNLTAEEKENNLKITKESITNKENQLSEYQSLLTCVKDGKEYTGSNDLVNSSYSEYYANYKKLVLMCNQYKSVYQDISAKLDTNSENAIVTSMQVESAKLQSDEACSTLVAYKSNYLSDVRSQILLLENQLNLNGENTDTRALLTSYIQLKNALEQGYEFHSNNNIQESYNQYLSGYQTLTDDYSNKYSAYNDLYNTYIKLTCSDSISQSDVNNAKYAYENSQLDVEVLKNTFVSQLESKINALEDEIRTLDNNKKSLKLSIKGIEDLDEYEKLSGEKLKNEAVITLNSEIDSLSENITSIKSQLLEVNETIKNSEVKASYDGTVTLVDELNSGDVVQAGSPLCSVIPAGKQLKVTLYVPENEVSKIQVGQKTEYIFDAIPYNEYGKITGEILSISADSVVNESAGTKFYIAQANLSASSLENSNGSIREVKTGMMVEAKTISSSKKAIVWLLQKINLMD